MGRREDAWHDPLTMADWKELIGRPNPGILEIGANDGTDTLRFLEAFPQSRIWCFEPDPRAAARFRRHVRSDRVELIEEAVSWYNAGASPWYASHGRVPAESSVAPEAQADWDLSGSLLPPSGHTEVQPWCTFRQEGTVAVTSLDSWSLRNRAAAAQRQFDLVWIDAQGAEGDVLLGGRSVLERTRLLYMEFYDQALNDQDYRQADLYRDQPGLAELLGILGRRGRWRLLGLYYGGNILLRNIELATAAP